jgi:hypothetical protein
MKPAARDDGLINMSFAFGTALDRAGQAELILVEPAEARPT